VFVTAHPTVAGAFRTIADHLEQPGIFRIQ